MTRVNQYNPFSFDPSQKKERAEIAKIDRKPSSSPGEKSSAILSYLKDGFRVNAQAQGTPIGKEALHEALGMALTVITNDENTNLEYKAAVLKEIAEYYSIFQDDHSFHEHITQGRLGKGFDLFSGKESELHEIVKQMLTDGYLAKDLGSLRDPLKILLLRHLMPELRDLIKKYNADDRGIMSPFDSRADKKFVEQLGQASFVLGQSFKKQYENFKPILEEMLKNNYQNKSQTGKRINEILKMLKDLPSENLRPDNISEAEVAELVKFTRDRINQAFAELNANPASKTKLDKPIVGITSEYISAQFHLDKEESEQLLKVFYKVHQYEVESWAKDLDTIRESQKDFKGLKAAAEKFSGEARKVLLGKIELIYAKNALRLARHFEESAQETERRKANHQLDSALSVAEEAMHRLSPYIGRSFGHEIEYQIAVNYLEAFEVFSDATLMKLQRGGGLNRHSKISDTYRFWLNQGGYLKTGPLAKKMKNSPSMVDNPFYRGLWKGYHKALSKYHTMLSSIYMTENPWIHREKVKQQIELHHKNQVINRTHFRNLEYFKGQPLHERMGTEMEKAWLEAQEKNFAPLKQILSHLIKGVTPHGTDKDYKFLSPAEADSEQAVYARYTMGFQKPKSDNGARILRAHIYLWEKDYEQAIPLYESLLKKSDLTDRQTLDILMNLIPAYMAKGKTHAHKAQALIACLLGESNKNILKIIFPDQNGLRDLHGFEKTDQLSELLGEVNLAKVRQHQVQLVLQTPPQYMLFDHHGQLNKQFENIVREHLLPGQAPRDLNETQFKLIWLKMIDQTKNDTAQIAKSIKEMDEPSLGSEKQTVYNLKVSVRMAEAARDLAKAQVIGKQKIRLEKMNGAADQLEKILDDSKYFSDDMHFQIAGTLAEDFAFLKDAAYLKYDDQKLKRMEDDIESVEYELLQIETSQREQDSSYKIRKAKLAHAAGQLAVRDALLKAAYNDTQEELQDTAFYKKIQATLNLFEIYIFYREDENAQKVFDKLIFNNPRAIEFIKGNYPPLFYERLQMRLIYAKLDSATDLKEIEGLVKEGQAVFKEMLSEKQHLIGFEKTGVYLEAASFLNLAAIKMPLAEKTHYLNLGLSYLNALKKQEAFFDEKMEARYLLAKQQLLITASANNRYLEGLELPRDQRSVFENSPAGMAVQDAKNIARKLAGDALENSTLHSYAMEKWDVADSEAKALSTYKGYIEQYGNYPKLYLERSNMQSQAGELFAGSEESVQTLMKSYKKTLTMPEVEYFKSMHYENLISSMEHSLRMAETYAKQMSVLDLKETGKIGDLKQKQKDILKDLHQQLEKLLNEPDLTISPMIKVRARMLYYQMEQVQNHFKEANSAIDQLAANQVQPPMDKRELKIINDLFPPVRRSYLKANNLFNLSVFETDAALKKNYRAEALKLFNETLAEVEKLKNARQKQGDSFTKWTQLAEAYQVEIYIHSHHLMKRYDKAIHAFQELEKPNNAYLKKLVSAGLEKYEYSLWKANLYKWNNDFDKARQIYEELIQKAEKYPSFAEARKKEDAELYINRFELQLALADLTIMESYFIQNDKVKQQKTAQVAVELESVLNEIENIKNKNPGDNRKWEEIYKKAHFLQIRARNASQVEGQLAELEINLLREYRSAFYQGQPMKGLTYLTPVDHMTAKFAEADSYKSTIMLDPKDQVQRYYKAIEYYQQLPQLINGMKEVVNDPADMAMLNVYLEQAEVGLIEVYTNSRRPDLAQSALDLIGKMKASASEYDLSTLARARLAEVAAYQQISHYPEALKAVQALLEEVNNKTELGKRLLTMQSYSHLMARLPNLYLNWIEDEFPNAKYEEGFSLVGKQAIREKITALDQVLAKTENQIEAALNKKLSVAEKQEQEELKVELTILKMKRKVYEAALSSEPRHLNQNHPAYQEAMSLLKEKISETQKKIGQPKNLRGENYAFGRFLQALNFIEEHELVLKTTKNYQTFAKQLDKKDVFSLQLQVNEAKDRMASWRAAERLDRAKQSEASYEKQNEDKEKFLEPERAVKKVIVNLKKDLQEVSKLYEALKNKQIFNLTVKEKNKLQEDITSLRLRAIEIKILLANETPDASERNRYAGEAVSELEDIVDDSKTTIRDEKGVKKEISVLPIDQQARVDMDLVYAYSLQNKFITNPQGSAVSKFETIIEEGAKDKRYGIEISKLLRKKFYANLKAELNIFNGQQYSGLKEYEKVLTVWKPLREKFINNPHSLSRDDLKTYFENLYTLTGLTVFLGDVRQAKKYFEMVKESEQKADILNQNDLSILSLRRESTYRLYEKIHTRWQFNVGYGLMRRDVQHQTTYPALGTTGTFTDQRSETFVNFVDLEATHFLTDEFSFQAALHAEYENGQQTVQNQLAGNTQAANRRYHSDPLGQYFAQVGARYKTQPIPDKASVLLFRGFEAELGLLTSSEMQSSFLNQQFDQMAVRRFGGYINLGIVFDTGNLRWDIKNNLAVDTGQIPIAGDAWQTRFRENLELGLKLPGYFRNFRLSGGMDIDQNLLPVPYAKLDWYKQLPWTLFGLFKGKETSPYFRAGIKAPIPLPGDQRFSNFLDNLSFQGALGLDKGTNRYEIEAFKRYQPNQSVIGSTSTVSTGPEYGARVTASFALGPTSPEKSENKPLNESQYDLIEKRDFNPQDLKAVLDHSTHELIRTEKGKVVFLETSKSEQEVLNLFKQWKLVDPDLFFSIWKNARKKAI